MEPLLCLLVEREGGVLEVRDEAGGIRRMTGHSHVQHSIVFMSFYETASIDT